MRTATIVSVTSERQLELPAEFLSAMKPSDIYSVWMSEDSRFISIKKIYESLNENKDDFLGRVEKAGEIKLPTIMTQKLKPNTDYLVTQVTTDDISLEKVRSSSSLDDLFAKMDEIGDVPDQMSMAEICQIVKEVRREQAKKKHESHS
jgi:hypothetical protein